MADSPAELAYRLKNEQRCTEIARELKPRLDAEGLSFCLVMATIDGKHEQTPKRFSNVSYVSTCRREDAARLLTELVDTWWTEGTVTEPSVKTITVIREAVFKIRGTPLDKVMTNARHRVREVIDATSARDRAKAALLLACEALAVFDVESRRAMPRKGD
jgi:hypothetical protein